MLLSETLRGGIRKSAEIFIPSTVGGNPTRVDNREINSPVELNS